MPDTNHICERSQRWALYDARGIFCCYACSTCETEKKQRYRVDVFTDPNYWADEPIDS